MDDDTDDTEEAVKTDMVGLKTSSSDRARVLPVAETDTLVVRSSAQVNDETTQDQAGNE